MTSDNSKAIIVLCSMIGATDEIVPLTPSEWDALARSLASNDLEPKDILFMSAKDLESRLNITEDGLNRIHRLVDRAGSIAFEIEKYQNIGISIVTRADSEYPQTLKKKLKSKCPPLFYVAGDISICNEKAVGFVGSRNIDANDLHITKELVEKAVEKGYSIVSGGARGTDQASQAASLYNDGKTIIYVADSLMSKLRDPETIRAIREDKAVILSVAKPDAGFNTGIAMMRNKYIYAQSDGTVVIKSDYNKGGTWTGANENLKNKWSLTYCVNNEKYKGNMELIKRGAIPIDENWDVDISTDGGLLVQTEEAKGEQLTLFSLISE